MAEANTAAANYHFGDKETLYVESRRFAFEQSLRTYPPDGGVPGDAPLEERLRGRILAIMRRVIDPRSHELDIICKETANPTGLLAGIRAIKEQTRPTWPWAKRPFCRPGTIWFKPRPC